MGQAEIKKDENNACLVCFLPHSLTRKQLPKYVCKCDYPIHFQCYQQWKIYYPMRLCIICNVTEFDWWEDQERRYKKTDKYVTFFRVCFFITLF